MRSSQERKKVFKDLQRSAAKSSRHGQNASGRFHPVVASGLSCNKREASNHIKSEDKNLLEEEAAVASGLTSVWCLHEATLAFQHLMDSRLGPQSAAECGVFLAFLCRAVESAASDVYIYSCQHCVYYVS